MVRSTYRIGFPLKIGDKLYKNRYDSVEEQEDFISVTLEEVDEMIQRRIDEWAIENNFEREWF